MFKIMGTDNFTAKKTKDNELTIEMTSDDGEIYLNSSNIDELLTLLQRAKIEMFTNKPSGGLTR